MGRNARIGRSKLELPAPRRTGRRRGNGAIALAAAAAVAVSAVFALGLALGKRKDPGGVTHAPPPATDPLAALDRAEPPAPAPTPTQATYVFHDALTKERPPDTLAQVGHAPKPAPTPSAKPGTAVTTARVVPPAAPTSSKPAPAASANPAPATPAVSASVKPAAPAPRPAAAPAASASSPAPRLAALATAAPAARPIVPPPAAALRARGWTIQLVATPKESEAQRLAARHPGARVVPAEVDGKRWYRVQLGSFDTQERARAELPSVGRPGAFVTMR